MAEWEKQVAAINLIVRDVGVATAFYRDVFGLSPQQADPDFAMFRFKDTYVFLQGDAAHEDTPAGEWSDLAEKGIGQFAIIVDDVDAVRAELDEHGVAAISGPADRDWGMRTLTFADPGGYTWEIAQPVAKETG